MSTVGIPSKYLTIFAAGGAAIGLVAAFIVGPVVAWLLGLIGDAPGPLRLAAELPFVWAVPVLTILGGVGGFLVASSWTEDAGTIDVAEDGLTVHTKDADRFIKRDRIAHVIAEKKALVLIDDGDREVLRSPLEDEMVPGLRAALDAHGYPPLDTSDPFEDAFTTWVDGDGRQDGEVEELLRARRRALADKQPGAAEEALHKLRDLGVMVRDRDGRQQYRVVDL
ncbi:MAG: YqeB family protein [Mycobacteriaceae bacterium]|uniref:YqeB family protein n=1 Tax=Corynebacterium sp. TaxID=1720 RepID=UPI003F99C043